MTEYDYVSSILAAMLGGGCLGWQLAADRGKRALAEERAYFTRLLAAVAPRGTDGAA